MAAGFRQSTNCVDSRTAKPDDEIACPDQCEGFLLLHRSVRDGAKDLRVQPCETCQLLGIDLVAFTVTVRDRPQLTHVRHDHFVAQFLRCSLIQIECVPASMATRAGGRSVNHFSRPSAWS
jgi:hypothetical protein